MREIKIREMGIDGKPTGRIERIIDDSWPKGFEDTMLCSHQNVTVDPQDDKKGFCNDCENNVYR